MAKKKAEPQETLSRTYIIPLRKEWLKVPEYKRANKAAKAIREFIVRHMKIYDRDLKKVKIDILLNNELRFRGMRKPPAKIKVRAVKFDNDIIKVSLVEIPEHIRFQQVRERKKQEAEKKKREEEKKKQEELKKAAEKAKAEKEAEEKAEEDKGEKKERKEKKEAVKEAGLKQAKKQAKQAKHIAKGKQPKIQRKALAK